MVPENPKKRYASEFRTSVRRALDEMGVEADPVIEEPKKGEADLCMVCFPLAGKIRMPPDEIARSIREKMPDSDLFEVSENGGYLNCIFRRPDYIMDILDHLWKYRDSTGEGNEKGERILIEHTSANPNGPFHVGRARNPIIGDTLVRVMDHAGYHVGSQYWVNDMGKQAMILVWGMANLSEDDLPPAEREKEDHYLVRYYQKANSMMEDREDIAHEIDRLLGRYEMAVAEGEMERNISSPDLPPITPLDVRKACDRVLSGMKRSLVRLNVKDQEFIYESRVVEDGSLREVIDRLKRSPLCREENGASYLDLSGAIKGGDGDRFKRRFVFTKSNGSALYTTRDLAYHKWKLERWDRAINILGEDHRYQSMMLSLALKELGMEKRPEPVFYSFVSLPEGKMSTRRGRVVYLDDLLDDAVRRAREEVEKRREDLPEGTLREISEAVGIGALRFNMQKVQTEKKIVFRWGDALNFEGSSAPFVQYSHARACSILKKAGEWEKGMMEWDRIVERSERDLAVKLSELGDVVRKAARDRKVHLVNVYLVDTASAFNDFYRDCPVLSESDPERRRARLALVELTREVISTGLDLLGIEAPDSM